MRSLSNLIETDRLLLSWQAQESEKRSRYIVGELVRSDEKVVLNYFTSTEDFSAAREHGFSGYPAFQINMGKSFDSHVLEAFIRRLPSRKRGDFSRYMELHGIDPDSQISDFTLLGYTGAKLPNDGFELVHPFETDEESIELIIEIAGFRHESEVPVGEIHVGDEISFRAEPENEHDSSAIRIEKNHAKLGYVDRGRLGLFHSHLNRGADISGEVARKNGTSDRPLIYVFTNISTS